MRRQAVLRRLLRTAATASHPILPADYRADRAVYSSVRAGQMPYSPACGGAERPTTFLVQAVKHARLEFRRLAPRRERRIDQRLGGRRHGRLSRSCLSICRRAFGCPMCNSLDTDAFVHQLPSPSSSVAAVRASASGCFWHGAARSISADLAQQLYTSFISLFRDLRPSLARAEHFCRKHIHMRAHNIVIYQSLLPSPNVNIHSFTSYN